MNSKSSLTAGSITLTTIIFTENRYIMIKENYPFVGVGSAIVLLCPAYENRYGKCRNDSGSESSGNKTSEKKLETVARLPFGELGESTVYSVVQKELRLVKLLQ